MDFDKTLPNNTTKIRNYPSVLTANFSSIEEGDDSLQHWKSNFIERNAIPSAPPVDPTRIDDTMQIFSKQNADGETDLFVIDDRATANIIEITENGKIGGQSTQAVVQDISFGTETTDYSSTHLVGYWATINSAGAIVDQSGGLTAIKNAGTGKYTVSFTTAQSSANYGVHLTVENANSGENAHIANYHTKAVGSVQVSLRNGNNTSVDKGFTITVYGGRS